MLLNTIIDWLETHPNSASLISDVIVVCISTIGIKEIMGFVFKPSIELRNKRVVAESTFYPELLRLVSSFRQALERKSRLDCNPDTKSGGNIFLSQFDLSQIRRKYPYYRSPSTYELYLLNSIARNIISLVEKSDENVPPRWINKSKWYGSQSDLLLFCYYLCHLYEYEKENRGSYPTNGWNKDSDLNTSDLDANNTLNALHFLHFSIEKSPFHRFVDFVTQKVLYFVFLLVAINIIVLLLFN